MKKKILIFFLLLVLFVVLATADSISFAREVNYQRSLIGLEPLRVDHSLSGVAKDFARVCARHGNISHDYLTNDEVWSLMVKHGADNYRSTGEVLAYSDQESMKNDEYILNLFMQSPTHKEILMDQNAVTIGVGSVTSCGRTYFAAFVGRRHNE